MTVEYWNIRFSASLESSGYANVVINKLFYIVYFVLLSSLLVTNRFLTS